MGDNKCQCGEESTRGCHGMKNGAIYDEYFCDYCYNNKSNLKKEVKYVKRKTNEPNEVSDGTEEQAGIERTAS